MATTISQSFSWWCFANGSVEPKALIEGAVKIGYKGVDLIDEEYWPAAKQAGLRIAAVNGHGTIEDGLNRFENADRIEAELRQNIKKARDWNIPVLICFSGMRESISDEEGLAQCASTLSRVTPYAEEAGVTLAMELLNSKVDHPAYQCDHTAWGMELWRRVDSQAFGLLYDIYHMQVMEGNIIDTISANRPALVHFHTAGVPGRGIPDEYQELNYPAIYGAIARLGFNGFISHEFLTVNDPLEAMAKAYNDCQAVLDAVAAEGEEKA